MKFPLSIRRSFTALGVAATLGAGIGVVVATPASAATTTPVTSVSPAKKSATPLKKSSAPAKKSATPASAATTTTDENPNEWLR